jgi:16S rRNA (guanine527-N7)-methyltransferase
MMARENDIPPWLDVSRETIQRLDSLLELVLKWNGTINLVSKSSLPEAWARHVLDSAQLWGLAKCQDGHWLDIGSGAGFPGMVMAVIAHEKAPGLFIG